MAPVERVGAAMLGDGGRVPPDTVRALSRGRGRASPEVVTTSGSEDRLDLVARRMGGRPSR